MKLEIEGYTFSLFETEYQEVFVDEGKVRIVDQKGRSRSITFLPSKRQKSYIGAEKRMETKFFFFIIIFLNDGLQY